jgi:hypothetical protein
MLEKLISGFTPLDIHLDCVPSDLRKVDPCYFCVEFYLQDNKDLTGVTVIEDVLYPLIAVIGEKNNASKIRLLNLAKPPEVCTIILCSLRG